MGNHAAGTDVCNSLRVGKPLLFLIDGVEEILVLIVGKRVGHRGGS